MKQITGNREIDTQARTLFEAIRSSSFSGGYKRQLQTILANALDSRNPKEIARMMMNIDSLINPKGAGTYDDIRKMEPLGERPMGKTGRPADNASSEATGSKTRGNGTISSQEIWDTIIEVEKPQDRFLQSLGIDTKRVEKKKGTDGEVERKKLKALDDMGDPKAQEKVVLKITNPALFKMIYGSVDSAIFELRNELKGTWVIYKNEGEYFVPLGIVGKAFYDLNSVEITGKVARDAEKHYLKLLGESQNETHISYHDVGPFVKAELRFDSGKKVHAIVFYDNSPSAMEKIAPTFEKLNADVHNKKAL